MFNHSLKFIFPGLLALYSFLNIWFLDGDRLSQAELPLNITFSLIFFISYAVWFFNAWIERFAPKRFKITHPLIIQFLLSLIAVIFITLIAVLLTGVVFGGPFSYSFQNFLLTSAFGFRINLFLNSVNAIYFFFTKYKAKEIEAQKLKVLNANAKLATISNQINPHFFFNNLSALSNLIHEDIDLADEYLLRLSNIYRYILKHNTEELISFRQELEFLKDYVALLKIRFQNALKFNFEITEECNSAFIPPAVLQLLIENVVKHNIFTNDKPMEVWVCAKDEECKIKNQKQEKVDKSYSSGIGLQNIRDRYKFLGKEIEIIDTGSYFEVKLPLIKSHENPSSRR
jgi:two-component system LytT family sensor kinase